ncbi:MAG: hypothetical protein HUU32_18660 [Calditrichaceae bacterium]|nr:hypothetical protein [Calditrichia bacterium]NUQ43415.1 hypothetical protein [Calditrichaceae bacterium]
MKQQTFYLFLMGAFLCALLTAGPARAGVLSDTTRADTTETQVVESDTNVVYTNVDVVVESDWSKPERTERVSVEILFKNKKPDKVLMKGAGYKMCEITLMEGMTVKIINHKTGKLIKTYKP